MGFDLFELGLENLGDWDPERMAEVFAANDLSAAVCAAMGPGRDLTDPDAVDSTRDYLRACIDAVALGGQVVAGPIHPGRQDLANGRRRTCGHGRSAD